MSTEMLYRWTCGHYRNDTDPAGRCPTCAIQEITALANKFRTESEIGLGDLVGPVVFVQKLIEKTQQLNLLAIETAIENKELRKAIRNQAGDNLCWLTIGENHPDVKIPPREEFLKSCERFHAQIAGDSGVLTDCKTIAQLEAEVSELRERLNP